MAAATKAKPSATKSTKTRFRISREWVGFALATVASAALLLWRLAALTANLASANEIATKRQLLIDSPWWKSPANIYGPYYLLLHATFAINHSLLSFRLASAVIGLAVVGGVYWVATQWHGYKIGLMSAAIILTSFGLLASARLATPLVSQLLLITALLVALVLVNQAKSSAALIVFGIICAGSLYIPGGIFLAIAALILTRRTLKAVFALEPKPIRARLAIAELVLITPIVYHLIRGSTRSAIASWLGYGLRGNQQAAHNFLINLIHAPLDLFVHSSGLTATLSLGHLPLLPITFGVLTAIGLYCYLGRLANWRWQAVLVLFVLGWLLSGFGVFSPLALLPLAAVIAGTGCAFLLKEWYDVFPLNHIARACGLVLMFAVVIFSGFYAARSYYVAWANNPKTTAVFVRRI